MGHHSAPSDARNLRGGIPRIEYLAQSSSPVATLSGVDRKDAVSVSPSEPAIANERFDNLDEALARDHASEVDHGLG